MNPLEKMIALVKRDPAITVAELASSLGYSEEKSVYYWLEKAGYGGIRELKRDVLGEERVKAEHSELADVLALQQGTGGRTTGNPFTFTVPSSQYVPLFLENDVLIIDPVAAPRNGDYVLVSYISSPTIMRYYCIDDREVLAGVHDPQRILKPGANITILGRISRLIRTL